MSACRTRRGCFEKHEGFSANPWCLWVSDISYIQTEDLEDPDEGEYLVEGERAFISAFTYRRRGTRDTTHDTSVSIIATRVPRDGDSIGDRASTRKIRSGVTCSRAKARDRATRPRDEIIADRGGVSRGRAISHAAAFEVRYVVARATGDLGLPSREFPNLLARADAGASVRPRLTARRDS